MPGTMCCIRTWSVLLRQDVSDKTVEGQSRLYFYFATLGRVYLIICFSISGQMKVNKSKFNFSQFLPLVPVCIHK